MRHFIKNQHRKAELYFTLIIFVNCTLSLIIVTGIIIGIKAYISDTKFAYEAVTCCGSICSKCFFTLRTLYTALPWLCIVILFTGICIAIRKTFSMLYWNYSFISSITPPSTKSYPKFNKFLSNIALYSQPIVLGNNKLHCAFTSGLWKPKIYLSMGICSYLTTNELLTVILHETYHKKNKDPLKLFLIQIFCALNFFLPINRYLLTLYSFASEKAADDSAINFSGKPLDLASALVKLSKFKTTGEQYSSVTFSSGQRILEDRIRRLLEPDMAPPCFDKTYLYLSCLLSIFFAATICLSLFYKSFLQAHTIECNTRTCHMDICG